MAKRSLLWWAFAAVAVVGFILILGAAGGVEHCNTDLANASRPAGIGIVLMLAGIGGAKAVD